MVVLSSFLGGHHLGLGDDGGGGDSRGDGSSDEAGGEGSSGEGSDNGGVVDHVVGGVGRGLGVNVDAGNVVDGVAHLVANETGLGDQVGLDGLVHGGGGDSDRDGGVDGLHVDSGDSVDSSDGSSMDGGDRGSSDSRGSGVGGSDGGSGSNGGDGRGGGHSGGGGVGKSVSSKADTGVASSEETVSGDQLSVGVSSRGSHGGAEEGGKDNLEERRVDKHSIKVTFGRMLETVVFVLFVSNEGLTKEFIFVRVVQATMPLSGERCPL